MTSTVYLNLVFHSIKVRVITKIIKTLKCALLPKKENDAYNVLFYIGN